MIDLIHSFVTDLTNLALLGIGLAAIAGAIGVFIKTKSGGAACGVLILGVVAIAIGANLDVLADLLGDDITTRGGTGDTGSTGNEWGTTGG